MTIMKCFNIKATSVESICIADMIVHEQHIDHINIWIQDDCNRLKFHYLNETSSYYILKQRWLKPNTVESWRN